MSVRVIGPRDKGYRGPYINTTSRSPGWSRGLSPFFLGPIRVPYGPTSGMVATVKGHLESAREHGSTERCIDELTYVLRSMEGDIVATNVENAWQYSKVYDGHDLSGEPTPEWFQWRFLGFRKERAVRYPMGKGATPLYSWVGGKRLTYIEARKQLYIPAYSSAVRDTEAFAQLRKLYDDGQELVLWDFDGYDHQVLGMSWDDVMTCETRKMGHAFVLAMMLEGVL